eukprot:2537297-Rhodomonas_salina.2
MELLSACVLLRFLDVFVKVLKHCDLQVHSSVPNLPLRATHYECETRGLTSSTWVWAGGRGRDAGAGAALGSEAGRHCCLQGLCRSHRFAPLDRRQIARSARRWARAAPVPGCYFRMPGSVARPWVKCPWLRVTPVNILSFTSHVFTVRLLHHAAL